MHIDWNEIKETSPESYNKYIVYFSCTSKKIKPIPKENIDNISLQNHTCYCDLEKFFEDNGIIICVNYFNEKSKWVWDIYNYDSVLHTCLCLYEDRDKAKKFAVEKAFEILESKL